MNFKVHKQRGIGNVITTLIILIASVVLGAGVIFFGGSMFQTNTTSESVKVSNVHSWVANNGTAVTAFAIQNTGSKPVTINSISLRGQPVPQGNWFSCVPSVCGTATNVNTELTTQYIVGAPATAPPASKTINLASGAVVFTPATAGLGLNQGQATIVYLNQGGSIAQIDSGNTYALQIQAGQAIAVQQVQVVTAN